MPQPKPLPPLESLTDILHYVPETGDFIWLKPTSFRVKRGAVAGTVNIVRSGRSVPHKQLTIKVRGINYLAHRLAWLFGHGEDPGGQLIDHINGDSLDNRLTNLRLVNTTQNMWNVSRAFSTSKSGIRGVHQNKHTGKWVSEIRTNGKRHYLGVFVTKAEAAAAYKQAAEQRLSLISS